MIMETRRDGRESRFEIVCADCVNKECGRARKSAGFEDELGVPFKVLVVRVG